MRAHIDVNDEHQLKDWANRLGMTPEDLQKLVAEVGPDSDRIHDVLNRRESDTSGGRELPAG